MQNKGAIKLLTVLLVLACAYQLSFTLVTKIVENRAARYAAQVPPEQRDAKLEVYLDSVKSTGVYNLGLIDFTYKEVKEKELNLGLDLRGGMNVMMQISVEDVIRALSNDSKDPTFNSALAEARNQQKNSRDDFITLFAKAYNNLSGGQPLAYVFNTPDLKEHILPTSTNDEVVKVLKEQAESAISNSFNVLRNRIDRFGVVNPNIQRLDNGRVMIELPGVKEPERVRKLLQGTASLEFWTTYDNNEIFPILYQINEEVARFNAAASAQAATTAEESVQDEKPEASENDAILAELSESDETSETTTTGGNDLFSKLIPLGSNVPGPVVGMAASYDTAAVNRYFALPQVRSMLPRDLRLMWGVKAENEKTGQYALYAIRANTRDGKAPLDGGAVTDARENYAEHGANAEVSMTMNAAGGKAWARLTADNIGKSIAIVLDGYVYSAPTVQNEITGGRSLINGRFTIQEATDLANVLKSGKLPAPARIIQDSVVGPSLGKESIDAGMMSFLLAFVIVLAFMCIYYNRGGWYSCLALLTNLFLLFGVLVSFGAVLTLPGIAGIVLTMAMAIDANVIIYERIREELRAGKGLGLAVADGYKHALSAIIDSNLTSVITGVVLYMFGTGPVQGFATTFVIGIFTSFFTSVFISRLLIDGRISKGKKVSFSRKWNENFLTNTKFDFIGKRKYSYILSGLLILGTLVSLATMGLRYGVDFSGGRAYVIRFDRQVTDEEVRERMAAVFESTQTGFEVKTYGTSGKEKRILTQFKYDDESDQATAEADSLLWAITNPLFERQLTLEQFSSTQDTNEGIIQSEKIGPSVAHDIKRNSIIAVVFSLVAIGLYIILRFRKWQWGMGTVISLGHNALLVIGLFSAFHAIMPFTLEVDQSFIAALLTVIGYTINDNIVIFDRIREHQRLYPKRSMKENINLAINTTLTRTLNTSGSTVLVLLSIFLFGGTVIRGFIFAILFGVIVGTYSSVFIATPVAYDMMRKNKKDAKDAKVVN